MKPFPDVLRVEPAGICNFHCIHCPVGVEGGQRGILSLVDFKFFFSQVPITPHVLVLYHGGEPLLNKNLALMVAHAKKYGVSKVVLNTNASLLTVERGHELSQVDEMRISFDGESAAQNNRIRRGCDFEQYAERVRYLARSNDRPARMVIYNASTGTPAQYLLDYFAGVDVEFVGVNVRRWARVGNKPHATNGAIFCSNLFDTFTIMSNGDVPMCCEDLQGDDIQGNVFKETPQEIWERMETRRNAFINQEYPRLCQTCWVTMRRF
jgi:radical SAM protein with 4Fe4S-binding SPASM domain